MSDKRSNKAIAPYALPLFVPNLDAASTLKNAVTVVSNVTPEQKKRVQTILLRAK